MPTRKHNQNTYLHGSHNAECDVCGFKFKAEDLRERWDGLEVCADDWEPRHPSDFFRARAEEVSGTGSSDSSEAGGTDIEGNTFPPTRTDTTTDVPEGTNNGSL